MNKIISLIFLLFIGIGSQAQTNPADKQASLDSLHSMWQDEAQHDSTRVQAYMDFVWHGFLFSQPDTAFVLAENLLDFGRDNNYPKALDMGYNIQGSSWYVRGNSPKSLDYYNQSLTIRRQLGDQGGVAAILNNMGTMYRSMGDYPKALDYLYQSLKVHEQMGDQRKIATALNNIGVLHKDQGHYAKALDELTRSLKIKKQMGDQKEIAASLKNIGTIYDNQGDYPKALEFYTQGLKIEEKLGDQKEIAASLNNIGNIYIGQKDYPNALIYHTQSLKINQQIGDQLSIARSLHNIGNIFQNQGEYPQAQQHYAQSLEIRENIGDQNGIASSLNEIGNIYHAQDDYSKALMYHTRSLKIREKIGDQNGIASSFYKIGVVYKSKGNYAQALDYCQRAYELALAIGSLKNQKNGCACLYDTYKATGNGIKALEYLELYNAIEKSLRTEETAKKLQQMEFQKQVLADSLIQVEKDRLVHLAHDQEVRKKNKTRNVLAGSGLFTLLLAGGFFSRWRYVKKSKAIIEKEKDRSENLLLNILPAEIAEELKTKGEAAARDFDRVSILFTDFKEFTQLSEQLSAQELVSEINHCFKAFDAICSRHHIEKIKTIGDSYMAAGGLPVPDIHSAKNLVLAALEMAAFVIQRREERLAAGQLAFTMRAGIHTGPVVAGIVGVKKFQYDIWGDAVNTASRMESHGEIGTVNISQATYDIIKDDPDFSFEHRGKIEAKGKGEIEMYFVSLKENSNNYDQP